MNVPKERAVALLAGCRDEIPALKGKHRGGESFRPWLEKTRMIVANLFGQDSAQFKEFSHISYGYAIQYPESHARELHEFFVAAIHRADAKLQGMISEIETFWSDESDASAEPPIFRLETIFERFHHVARQLRTRHGDRATLDVGDEYDVQDLLHALLMVDFEDIRAEDVTPTYAGGSGRIDFILDECSGPRFLDHGHS